MSNQPSAIRRLTTGRIVLYKLSQADCDRIIRFRSSVNAQQRHAPLIYGNTPHAGDIVPAMVVRVWPEDRFNGQAFLDGNQTVWLTTIEHDQDDKRPGTWHWPEVTKPAHPLQQPLKVDELPKALGLALEKVEAAGASPELTAASVILGDLIQAISTAERPGCEYAAQRLRQSFWDHYGK